MTTAVAIERRRSIGAPIERAWHWLTSAPGWPLFTVNLFHVSAACDDAGLRLGSRIQIVHRLGPAREWRVARVTHLEPFVIAWSELKAEGRDWFPHSQRFALESDGPGRCTLHNGLRGTFHLAGASWWLLPWYRYVLPWILDAENRKIAAAIERSG